MRAVTTLRRSGDVGRGGRSLGRSDRLPTITKGIALPDDERISCSEDVFLVLLSKTGIGWVLNILCMRLRALGRDCAGGERCDRRAEGHMRQTEAPVGTRKHRGYRLDPLRDLH